MSRERAPAGPDIRKALVLGVALGTLAAVVLIVSVVLYGPTFGRRCERMGFPVDSSAWTDCVHQLRTGGAER